MIDSEKLTSVVKELYPKFTQKPLTDCDFDFLYRVLVYYFVHRRAKTMLDDNNVKPLFSTKEADSYIKAFDKDRFFAALSAADDYKRFQDIVSPKEGDKMLEKWCILIRKTAEQSIKSTMSTNIRNKPLPQKTAEMMAAKGLCKSAEEAQENYAISCKLSKFIFGALIFDDLCFCVLSMCKQIKAKK